MAMEEATSFPDAFRPLKSLFAYVKWFLGTYVFSQDL
jgi:hypothetical protein